VSRFRRREVAVADPRSSTDLPPGFTFPPEFVRVVEFGLVKLEPWELLFGESLRLACRGLRKRYPDHWYIPFAVRQDNDDTACWDGVPGTVVIVHDFASPGWEHEATFPSFHAWLRHTFEEFIEWGEEELGL